MNYGESLIKSDGTVMLPNVLSFSLDDELVLFSNKDCIMFFTEDKLKYLEDQLAVIRNLDNNGRLNLQRSIYPNSVVVKTNFLDDNIKFTIPKNFLMKHALKKQLIYEVRDNMILLWNPDRFYEYMDNVYSKLGRNK